MIRISLEVEVTVEQFFALLRVALTIAALLY